MKPLKLEIEGINSFREKQIIDFKELARDNLFCISGKTGSGKTTVLDCLILGLYQKLPSYSSRGKIEDYINLSCEKGEIKLTFELEGKIYRTERVISRKAGANSAKIVDVETGVAVREKTNEAFAFLEEKLGLDVDQFARVIVLQQGEFAQFLRASKGDRNAMVIKLFRLDRFSDVYQRFGAAARTLKGELDKKDAVLQGYEGDTQEKLTADRKTLKETINTLEKLNEDYKTACAMRDKATENERLKKQREQALLEQAELEKRESALVLREKNLAELEQRLVSEQPEIKKAISGKEELLRSSAKLESEKTLLSDLKLRAAELEKKRREYNSLLDTCNQKEKEHDAFLQDLEKTKRAAGEFADARADELSAKYKEAELTLTRKTKLFSDLKLLGNKKDAAEKAFAEAEKAAESAKKASFIAEKELAAARETLSRATLEEGSDAIKKGLHAGDVCPVCGEILKADPAFSCPHLKEAEQNVAECEKSAAARRKDYTEKAAAVAAIKETREQLFARFCECEKDASALPAVDENQVKKLKNGLDAVILLEKAHIDEQKIAAELAKLKSECELLLKRGVEDKRDYDERAKRLSTTDEAALSVTIELTEKNIKAIETRVEEFDKCNKKVNEEKLAVRSEKAEIDEKRKNLSERLNIKIDTSLAPVEHFQNLIAKTESARSELIEKKATLTASCEALEKRLETKRALKTERAGINKKYEKINSLSVLFARGEFNAFVATEYIKDFTFSASKTLSELTGGKYTLSYDEEESDFFVTDFLNSNEKRKARTLSGGETFLASLSMAIALSKEIARFGTFDFFFIDEGFGTLHDAALDQALDVLCELSKTSLVGLVTHRTELIGRIPVTLLVTEADGEKGSVCRIAE